MIERFLDHEQFITTACLTWLIIIHHFARWCFSDSPIEFLANQRKYRRRRARRKRQIGR